MRLKKTMKRKNCAWHSSSVHFQYRPIKIEFYLQIQLSHYASHWLFGEKQIKSFKIF